MQTEGDRELSNGDLTSSTILTEIKLIRNIGRFAEAKPMPGVRLGHCTLVFGENGWGKSTLADILRSIATKNPAIVLGRKTLGGDIKQTAVFAFGSRTVHFDGSGWVGYTPKIAVYDSAFINGNVFSGDQVSADHLKNQYGLVVGEEGVRRVRRIVEIDGENRDCNASIKSTEQEITALMRGHAPINMKIGDFIALEEISAIENLIVEKSAEVSRARKAKELKAAKLPESLPTPSDAQTFEDLFRAGLDDISEQAATAVRRHIEKHRRHGEQIAVAHESWLESGLPFADAEDCAFCGQPLKDRTLVDAYKAFFSDAYRNLSEKIRKARETCARYAKGDFRNAIVTRTERNHELSGFWNSNAQIARPQYPDLDETVSTLERIASDLDALLARKLENVAEPLNATDYSSVLSDWSAGRGDIERYNAVVTQAVEAITSVRDALDESQLPSLENALMTLNAHKRRYEPETVALIEKLDAAKQAKTALSKEKDRLREELNAHGKAITEKLGATINEYLRRLNAGFRIDYREPDYRGKEPAASYQILINEQPVSPRASEIDKPSFRNTLSAGDKSTLALAFFLARLHADAELGETIIVLDDPFTSLDQFRRQFTAIEIKKLCSKAAQTIVLSHDKMFLRLLWEKIDQSKIQSIALQTGAQGMSTIAAFSIPDSTQPRHVTERMQIEEFVEGEQHELAYIRTRLRTVSEDFYRRGDPGLFGQSATLDEIIRRLDQAPDDHPYKAALEDLREINAYSRTDNHAAIEGDPNAETNKEELLAYCRLVLDLTHGL